MFVALHRVNEVNAGDGLTLSPVDFEDHCRFLSHHFNVVPLAEQVIDAQELGDETMSPLLFARSSHLRIGLSSMR